MNVINVAEAKNQFFDWMARVAYGGERVVVARRDRELMAWISVEDLQRLEAFEGRADDRTARRYAALKQADTIRERILAERKGALLGDSMDILDEVRTEQVEAHASMR